MLVCGRRDRMDGKKNEMEHLKNDEWKHSDEEFSLGGGLLMLCRFLKCQIAFPFNFLPTHSSKQWSPLIYSLHLTQLTKKINPSSVLLNLVSTSLGANRVGTDYIVHRPDLGSDNNSTPSYTTRTKAGPTPLCLSVNLGVITTARSITYP